MYTYVHVYQYNYITVAGKCVPLDPSTPSPPPSVDGVI